MIARQLVERHGERLGALVSHEGETLEGREMVLAVRQFVEKAVVPVAQALDAGRAWPGELVRALGELGVFGALVPAGDGGPGLDPPTYPRLVEELPRRAPALPSVLPAPPP